LWIYEGAELLEKLKRQEKYNKLSFLACNYILHFNRSFARNILEYVCHSLLPIITNIAVFASVSLDQRKDLWAPVSQTQMSMWERKGRVYKPKLN
jgi:hypothetical protein